jgi:hypothetical protein
MNKTLATIKNALKFRLDLIEQLGAELNCSNEQPHNVEFKIQQLPDEQFVQLKSKLHLSPGLTKQNIIHTIRQTATIV